METSIGPTRPPAPPQTPPQLQHGARTPASNDEIRRQLGWSLMREEHPGARR